MNRPAVSDGGGDIGLLLIFSTRYAAGRDSYASSILAQEIMRHARSLSLSDRRTLIDEIGHAAHPEVWRECLALLRRLEAEEAR